MREDETDRAAAVPEFDPAAYEYELPPERIAARPCSPRDEARLLALERGSGVRRHLRVLDLPGLLRPGDLVVVNETRVIPARIEGRWERTGRARQLLLIREVAPRRWSAWVPGSRRTRLGDRIVFGPAGASATLIRKEGEAITLEFEGDVASLLQLRGRMPLPPYIRREEDAADRSDYQTIFARIPGAVAAPTAGLHFTERLLGLFSAGGIGLARICLHVGPGTFRPIRADDIRSHRVEAEEYSIEASAAQAIRTCRESGGRVVAVGTTTVRALESAAASKEGIVAPGSGWTDLTIAPPFTFRAVDVLLTNFHLPRSSLLLLVSAFAGRARVLDAYREAVEEGYRFYSYGDAMLVL